LKNIWHGPTYCYGNSMCIWSMTWLC
jgi:hypothetical protein